MQAEQAAVIAIVLATVILFLWGRWRHDIVAMAALLACVVAGVVPTAEAFAGFGHPAVITVACVLVLSRGLQSSGAVDAVARHALPRTGRPAIAIATITTLGAVLSAFMNNVGALALLMPVAIQIAGHHDLPPGRVLMPLAFGSILGGMTTLIGTPPNLIVAGFRAQAGDTAFGMFDFTPVGAAVAVIGVAFVALVGWRLVPARQVTGIEGFETGAYLTEVRVIEGGKAAGTRLREIEQLLDEAGAQIVGLVRNEVRISAPHPRRRVRVGDILMIEAEPESLATALSALGLQLEEAVQERRDPADAPPSADGQGETPAPEGSDRTAPGEEIQLLELAILPNSQLVGRSASDIRLRTHYAINLLAISRQGRRTITRLRTMRLREGDVLLMQGPPDNLADFAGRYGCVPLADRAVRIPDGRRALAAGGVMVASVATAAFGLVPAAVSFAGGVLGSILLRVVPPRTVYDAIDWPVIVLLAALIPVAGAMAETGTADLIARILLEQLAQGHALLALSLILIVTMTLSDFMNNAATAAVMCPIALGTAGQLGVNADPFLMAVAVGASCAFLTPIGHQNNTLILGPGGFRFGDYWRLGLPLEVIVIAVAIPTIMIVWPL